MSSGSSRITPQEAETLALKALSFVVGDVSLLSAFLAQSGVSPSEIGANAGDPGFLAGVMDFLLSDDGAAASFSRIEGLAPGHLNSARALLPGGNEPFWT